MANPKIVLAELDIDIKALLAAALQSKEALAKLKTELLALKDAGDTTSARFRSMQADMQQLTTIMNEQLKVLKQQVKKNEDLAERQQQVAKSAKKAANAQEDLAEAYQEAAEEIEGLSEAALDAAGVVAGLNAEVEKNNTLMAQEGAAKQVQTFTDYKNKVIEAAQSINIFNGGFEGFLSRTQEAGGVGKLFKNAMDTMKTGIEGMGTAFKANPVGAILTLLAPIITMIVDQLQKFAPITNAVEKAMAGLGPVIDVLTTPIRLLGEGIAFLINGFADLLGSMSSAADEAIKLCDAQALLDTQMALQEERNDKAKKQIDELIAKSQDQTLSEGERLVALQDAAKIEMKNYKERKKLVEDTYRVKLATMQQEKKLSEDDIKILEDGTDAQITKLRASKGITAEELADLQAAAVAKERIADEEGAILDRQAADRDAFRSKEKAKREADARDAETKRKKQADDALTHQKELLELFEAQNEGRGKNLKEQLQYEDDYAQKSLDILKEELRLKKISITEFKIAELKILRDKEKNKSDVTDKFANEEIEKARARLDLEQQRYKSLLDGAEELNTDLIKKENERLDKSLSKQLEQLAKEKGIGLERVKDNKENLGVLNKDELQFLQEIEAMTAENNTKKLENSQKLVDHDKAKNEERLLTEATARKEAFEKDMADNTTEWEDKKSLENQRYEEEKALVEERLRADREDGKVNEEAYNRELEALKETHNDNLAEIDTALADFQLEQKSKLFGEMANILGKESKAGKAFALAQATIDTYMAAQKAYLSQLTLDPTAPVRAAIAAGAAVAVGLKNIQKIVGVKDPKFEQGGLVQVGGNRHAAGGTLFTGSDGTRFEAEQGELIGVMNRNAAHHFMAFNNAFPAGGSAAPNYFANGGIVSREIAQQQLNVDELAAKIALANSAIPAPIVAVQDIITQGNSYVRVREDANF